ncbi:MAG: hypothetical protein GY723_19240 [bacterium]|nr:hypothetical protein [bacterium]MCP5071132.1 hypothetical protein [bacterium]
MALPFTPDVETILRSCVATLEAEIVPELTSDWGRYSGNLVAASLEYAITLLADPEAPARRRQELAEAIDTLRPRVEASGNAEAAAALEAASPYETASKLLVAAQNDTSPLAAELHAVLHPLLEQQLEAQLAASSPLLRAFVTNMQEAR